MIGYLGYDLAPLDRAASTQGGTRIAIARSSDGAVRHGGHAGQRDGKDHSAGLGPDRGRTRGDRTTLSVLAAGHPLRDRISQNDSSLEARAALEPDRQARLSRPGAPDARLHRGRGRFSGQPLASGSRPRERSNRSICFCECATVSPAPFSAFLHWRDMAVVSASPEWFYQTRGDRVVTRPIKGTRPRGETPAEDEQTRGRAGRFRQGSCRADHDRRPRTQ